MWIKQNIREKIVFVYKDRTENALFFLVFVLLFPIMPIDKRFDSLILDIDGTIWNTTDIVAGAWNHAIARSGLPAREVTGGALQKEFGKTMDVIARDLWPELTDDQQSVLMKLCCEEEQLALRANEADITYPGVRDCVRELSGRIPVFVVSNCQDGYIELTLSKTGLAACIKDYECFGRTGKGKADNLRDVIRRNSLAAPVYVGDTQGDCDACAEAGVPFIWAAYGFGTAGSYTARIDRFSELTDFFA